MEIQTKMSNLNNTFMSLKAYQTPKHCTSVYIYGIQEDFQLNYKVHLYIFDWPKQ